MCSGREMPNPAAIGSLVCRRTCAKRSFIPGGSSFRAPVIPVTVTQYTNPLECSQIVESLSSAVVGATMKTVSRDAARSHPATGSDSSTGRSGTMTPATPACAASAANRRGSWASTGLM